MNRILVTVVFLFLSAATAFAHSESDSAYGASPAHESAVSVSIETLEFSSEEQSRKFCMGKFCKDVGADSSAEEPNLPEASDENGGCTQSGSFSCFSPATILQDHGLRIVSQRQLRRLPDTTRRLDEESDIKHLRPPIFSF